MAASLAAFQSAEDDVRFSRSVVFIERASGDLHRFDVELAETGPQRVRGLMFRESLGPEAGMLFDFRPVRDVGIWMRNTLIPLDILFVRADGTIARITPDATPHSETIMRSGEPVAAVLEIAGGRAAELGLQVGDRVRHPWFE